MPSFYPRSVAGLIDFYETYIHGATANMTALNYTQIDIDNMTALLTALQSAHTGLLNAKAAFAEAVELKDISMNSAIKDIQDRSALIQADKKLADTVREAMGLPVHDKIPSHETPFQPSDLQIKPLSTGTIKIDWNANGNKSGTQYIIEVKFALDGNFQNVDTVTATKYDHKNQTPGVPAWYRITPRRGKLVGESSETVGVYT